MGFKEIINAIRQYPWQVTVAVISLIPLYIIDLKFLAKRKVGLSRKIEIAKERGHVTKGMIIKKDAKKAMLRQRAWTNLLSCSNRFDQYISDPPLPGDVSLHPSF